MPPSGPDERLWNGQREEERIIREDIISSKCAGPVTVENVQLHTQGTFLPILG